MITTIRDTFSIQGAREADREINGAFRALGKEDNYLMVEDDAPPASARKNH